MPIIRRRKESPLPPSLILAIRQYNFDLVFYDQHFYKQVIQQRKLKIYSLGMREDERNGNWFAVESKSFELTIEGEGKKTKFFITE